MGVVALQRLPIKASADSQTGVAQVQVPAGLAGSGGGFGAAAGAGVGGELEWQLVSRQRSSVGLRWPSNRIAALHRLPIRSVLAAQCALRCDPMAMRSLRHLTADATLGACRTWKSPAANRPQRLIFHRLLAQ